MYISIAKVAVIVIPCITIFAHCQTNWEEIRPTFVTGKFVTTSHTTLQPYSQIQCVDRCFRGAKNGRCNVAGYNRTAQSCHLSTSSYGNIVDVADVSSGVFIVQLETTGNFISTLFYYRCLLIQGFVYTSIRYIIFGFLTTCTLLQFSLC